MEMLFERIFAIVSNNLVTLNIKKYFWSIYLLLKPFKKSNPSVSSLKHYIADIQ